MPEKPHLVRASAGWQGANLCGPHREPSKRIRMPTGCGRIPASRRTHSSGHEGLFETLLTSVSSLAVTDRLTFKAD